MRTALARRASVLFAVGALLAAPALAGCGGSSATSNPANEKITLTVNLFGDFGYKDLYAQYQKDHPNITIKENVTDYGTHHQNLQAHLVARLRYRGHRGDRDRSGRRLPAAGRQVHQLRRTTAWTRNQWTEQKWRAGPSPDGKTLFGVGTDIGGLALCYRSDLFQAAGLPDRPGAGRRVAAGLGLRTSASASSSWPRRRTSRSSGSTRRSNVFNAILGQGDQGVYDASRQRGRGPATRRSSRPGTPWSARSQAGESAGAGRVHSTVEHRFPEGPVRDDHLPVLDDRLHPRPTPRTPPGSGTSPGSRVPAGATGAART